MKSKENGTIQKAYKIERVKGDGPNWVLIAGGALLSTLSIRFGCMLKQALVAKGSNKNIKGTVTTNCDRLRPGVCQLHSDLYRFSQWEENCYNCSSGGTHSGAQIKLAADIPVPKEPNLSLQLVKVNTEANTDQNGGRMWASPHELLELPQKPFNHSAGSDSPSISESGSDIYTKREVISKLQHQLKKRDEMIMEMQNQIAALQSSLCTRLSLVAQLQSQLDSTNQDLFESEREIQRLRKVTANHCMKKPSSPDWGVNKVNEYVNGIGDLGLHCVEMEKGMGNGERLELLKKELGELREVIEGKDFVIQSYREQKLELCSTVKELEQRLESHQQHIMGSV
ncbi:hypothetical protein AXF42_Ash006029 [Apostasia shenzhenica]|uniref:Uncharacterized protein n=1 Tax=Apostasia shenzhenica TaxID=1088818 RepID=A0A2I0B004_9ASPA|nr:hypothetical protein AXF42_Ash006029 [Apostasia shenzhenica]